MRQDPELLVPASELRREPLAPQRPRWVIVLARLWVVLALGCAWIVFTAGTRELHFRAAALTIGGFALVWCLVAWIFGPALPQNDEQR